MSPTFRDIPSEHDYPQTERSILAYWKEINAFKSSYQKSVDENWKKFVFYDGPPFATGTPHFGNLLAGTIKDVVARHAHQTRHCVERRFGWDCHGLPVEHEVDKELGVVYRKDILKSGIANYNKVCRDKVMNYSTEWEEVTERLGRWIDFKNCYRTLDFTYMESVWWVFKQLFDKGLVYRTYKIMPYSTACLTTVSNLEAQENFKTIKTTAVAIAFQSMQEEGLHFVAWTTSPWTIPSNVALCMHPTLMYQRVRINGKDLVVLESRVEWLQILMKENPNNIEKVGEPVPGSYYKGHMYKPLYETLFFEEPFNQTGFMVICDTFVSDKTGSGIVHIAPAHGEDDYRVCLSNNILKPEDKLEILIDEAGKFTKKVPFLHTVDWETASKSIIKDLKRRKLFVHTEQIEHSCGHCWRSGTRLIYLCVPNWFINIQRIKTAFISNAENTHWVPDKIKRNRFMNVLSSSPDWAISRDRYWGAPIPIWVDKDYKQIVCIGSVAELQKYTDVEIKDLHREEIDKIEIPDPRGDEYPKLKRVPEVFDCWFESGSMPYGQCHYPFENKDDFVDSRFPADFIAEGLDQTRGWFYGMLVLSTALFGQSAYKNVVVTGLICDANNQKLSKHNKNYTSPKLIFEKHGADALRLYLLNSPLLKAENLIFTEEGVRDVVKQVFVQWLNSNRYLVQEANHYEAIYDETFVFQFEDILDATNPMDIWITYKAQQTYELMQKGMAEYRLNEVIPDLVAYLGDVSNWYLRLNRDRIRTQTNDSLLSLKVMFNALYTVVILMAPFTPFISEYIYQVLRSGLPDENREDSVHYVMQSTVDRAEELSIKKLAPFDEVEKPIKYMRAVIVAGRHIRDRMKIGIRTPLAEITVHLPKKEDLELFPLEIQNYITTELNILNLILSTDNPKLKVAIAPNFATLGKKFKQKVKIITYLLKLLPEKEILKIENQETFVLENFELAREDVIISRTCVATKDGICTQTIPELGIVVVLQNEVSEKIKKMHLGREITRAINADRKTLNLTPTSPVITYIKPLTEFVTNLLRSDDNYIRTSHNVAFGELDSDNALLYNVASINQEKIIICFKPMN